MAQIAKERPAFSDDKVIAVLFRDGDGTQSSGRGEWKAKYQSMLVPLRAIPCSSEQFQDAS